jgi:hypothetical protein
MDSTIGKGKIFSGGDFMWSGFCGDLTRRFLKRQLAVVMILLAALIAFSAWNYQYLSSFLLGPQTLSASQAESIHNLKSLKDVFVRISAPRAVDTGIQHITKNNSSPEGYVDSIYVLLPLQNDLLLARVDQNAPLNAAVNYAGRLRDMDSKLQAQIAPLQRMNPNLPPLLPFYLDTEDYRFEGYCWLVIGIAVLCFCIYGLWRYLQYSADLARHPFARKLARYGPLEASVQQIDSGMAGAHTEIKRRFAFVDMTQHWLIGGNAFNAIPMRLDSIAWVYRKVVKRRVYFVIPAGKQFSVIVYDRTGQRLTVLLDEAKTAQVIHELTIFAPGVFTGYDKRLAKLWRSTVDKVAFPNEARALIGSQSLSADQISTRRG